MAYRYDEDLEFLREMESKDIDSLVEILTQDKNGKARWTENLTKHGLYKQHYPDHQKYLDLILEEIQTFGGNTFANKVRGQGVLYKEILRDVADKMKANYNKNSSVETIETNLLMKVLSDSLEKMSEEERKEIIKSLEPEAMDSLKDFKAQTVTIALQALIRMGGFRSYQFLLILANAIAKAIVGKGLSLATNAALIKATSIFSGPIGLVITSAWMTIDIAGPAYRVTIPMVINICCLRQLQKIHHSKQQDTEENKPTVLQA